jgi:hypothetical protein
MTLINKILSRMISKPGQTLGEAIAESTNGVNLVDGKQTWELAEEKKNDLSTMIKCCEAELATYLKTGLCPAPFYFERVAILFRKQQNYNQEVEYCEKYIGVVNEYYRKNKVKENEGVKMGPRYNAIVKRLCKAKELLYKQENGDGR